MHMQRTQPAASTADAPGASCQRCGARAQSVCCVLDERDLARLAAVAVHLDFERGQTFIEEGDPALDFYNIIEGTVKLYKLLPDGRQQVMGFSGPGYFLGLAVSQTYAFSAQAIEPVRLCRFSRPKLTALMDDFPLLERRLLKTACNELAMAHEQMLLLGRKTARERVASFLLSRRRIAGTDLIHLPMTRAEIADYLGLTIETISRTLTKLRIEGRLRMAPDSGIVLLDRPWLEGLAGGFGPEPVMRLS